MFGHQSNQFFIDYMVVNILIEALFNAGRLASFVSILKNFPLNCYNMLMKFLFVCSAPSSLCSVLKFLISVTEIVKHV